ncbi:MAG: hypothetical protein WBZ16_10235 [Pseudolabrys sp.]
MADCGTEIGAAFVAGNVSLAGGIGCIGWFIADPPVTSAFNADWSGGMKVLRGGRWLSVGFSLGDAGRNEEAAAAGPSSTMADSILVDFTEGNAPPREAREDGGRSTLS